MKTKHYFNTTNQDADFVSMEIEKCKSQEEIIFDIFSDGKQYSASDVWEKYFEIKVHSETPTPITSIRRAITNLTYVGKLVKLNETKIGMYGKPEHYYEVRDKQTQLF